MNKNLKIFLSASLVIVALVMTQGCDWFKKSDSSTAATEVKAPSFYLLDANPEDIYKAAHIPGALNVNSEAKLDELSKNWNKNAPIVVYCSPMCGTKDLIAKRLKGAGFNDVKVYVGGITEWNKLSKENKAAYPLEGDAKHPIFEKEGAVPVQRESSESEITANQLKNYLQEVKK